MRKITFALLMGAYLFIALTAAALLWRGGAGWGAGMAILPGLLGLLFAAHAMLSNANARAAITKDVESIREAHRLLADALETTQEAVNALAEKVDLSATQRTEDLSNEVRMLEDLVHRMGQDLESRLAGIITRPVSSRRREKLS